MSWCTDSVVFVIITSFLVPLLVSNTVDPVAEPVIAPEFALNGVGVMVLPYAGIRAKVNAIVPGHMEELPGMLERGSVLGIPLSRVPVPRSQKLEEDYK